MALAVIFDPSAREAVARLLSNVLLSSAAPRLWRLVAELRATLALVSARTVFLAPAYRVVAPGPG
jgi:hypothetical protein